jgi:hypothetical protein
MSKSMTSESDGPPMVDPVGATSMSKSRLLTPGQEVLGGRFRIESLLGAGGMGEVYAAEQASLGRKVALKVLSADMSLVPGMAERFRREALLLSSIDHPAVVRIIDFGEWNGSACLVMELVRGESLEVLARGGPMSAERALPMLIQLAEGLGAIHAAGIIHRDLKLENVIVSEGTQGEQARLLDFGIARLAQPEGGSSATQAGVVLGTPEYMSPEQALGRALDARSDLYAWGLVAYRLLTGRHPLPGPTARDFILQQISEIPVPLQQAAPHLAGHSRLVELVSQCLEKESERRPQSAAALVDALRQRNAAPIPLVHEAPRRTPVSVPVAELAAPVLAAARRSGEWAVSKVKQARKSPKMVAAIPAIVAVVAIVALSVRSYQAAPDRVAAQQLAGGDARGALATLRVARAEHRLEPDTWALEARALHALGKHDDEWAAVAQLPGTALDALTPDDAKHLIEDFGRNEKARGLHEELNRLAQRHFDLLKAAATGSERDLRWGATRYLDAWGQATDEVLRGYIAALQDPDCARRGAAAKRLGEVGDDRAVGPLEELKTMPRKRSFIFEDNCGQSEAAQALKKLAKRNSP